MPSITRRFASAVIAIAMASLATFAFALPGPAACLLVGVADLHELSDGILAEQPSESDRMRYLQLTSAARARIEATFGSVEAKPILVYFSNGKGFGPFKLNSFGSTQFIGSRACVMVGPQGQNVDVVAHELMHAELHHRIGYLQRFLQVPTWFDEGVAMQVDYRARYTLSPADIQAAGYVRELGTPDSFFTGNEQAVVRNYAAAKAVVADWLRGAGAASLYSRFNRLKNGEAFAKVLASES